MKSLNTVIQGREAFDISGRVLIKNTVQDFLKNGTLSSSPISVEYKKTILKQDETSYSGIVAPLQLWKKMMYDLEFTCESSCSTGISTWRGDYVNNGVAGISFIHRDHPKKLSVSHFMSISFVDDDTMRNLSGNVEELWKKIEFLLTILNPIPHEFHETVFDIFHMTRYDEAGIYHMLIKSGIDIEIITKIVPEKYLHEYRGAILTKKLGI